jgi:hypothetical protein
VKRKCKRKLRELVQGLATVIKREVEKTIDDGKK